MGTHVNVSLPPVAGSNVCEHIGESVQYTRHYARVLQDAGVPALDDESWFTEDRDTATLVETLGQLQLLMDRYDAIREEQGAEWQDAHRAYLHVEQWVALYDTVIKLRARGLAAALFGA